MKVIIKYFIIIAGLLGCIRAGADNKEYDVFTPIGKYLVQGNYESLSAWFDDTLEISILSPACDASKAQAKQILKSFIEENTPREFSIKHTAGKAKSRYAVGNLTAGGVIYRVTIFVSCKNGNYRIQQLKIESM